MGTSCSIDVHGLASRYTRLNPGGLYAIVGDDGRVLDSLALQSVLSGLPRMPAALLTSRAPGAMLAHKGKLAPALRAAVAAGSVTLLGHEGRAASPATLLDGLIADLAHFIVGPRSLVVLDGAECLFGEPLDHDAAMLRRLRNWVEDRDAICLLLCRASAVLPRLLDRSQQLAGLTGVRSEAGRLVLEVFHWFGEQGVAGPRSFDIDLIGGRVQAMPEEHVPAQGGAEPAGDERVVVALRSAVQQGESPPRDWLLCDDIAALEARAATAVAATVVLPFTGTAGVDRLARAVHALRRNCGNRLKIVIREITVRLRYSQEALILRLGANMVIPAEVEFARVLSLLGVVQNQVFAHRLPACFEQAMTESAPELEHGYLPPAAFLQAAHAVLDAGRALGLQDVLLRLPLGYGLQPLDALRYCAIKRAGDLCTADDHHVFVLLHACREADIDMTLERLFRLPVAEFFTSETRYLSPEQIRLALEDLQRRHDQRRFADLSTGLAARFDGDQAARSTPMALPPTRAHEIRYSAPPPAQRRPLRQRRELTLVEGGGQFE